jgi:hypothetical protein
LAQVDESELRAAGYSHQRINSLKPPVCVCCCLCCFAQVDESELRAAGYSPATIIELQRWRETLSLANYNVSRSQHTKTAVAAIQFIVRYEPNPGRPDSIQGFKSHFGRQATRV